MGRVIFMCGPAGSGKSTVARQYEHQGMVRLSFDQEAWSRGITATVYLATDRTTVLQRIAARAARSGDDFKLRADLAATYFDHFEVPTAAEGPLTILR
jgi:gluconate kinase